MGMTRKEFCAAFSSVSVLLVLQGCGGGDSGYGGSPSPSPGPAPGSCGASGTEIAGNHGHVLVIARADLDAMTNQTYSIAGTAGHDHTVTFTPAQLQQLKAGTAVAVTSSFTGHDHVVTASCP